MGELGRFALLLGLCLSSHAILADLLGTWRGRDELWRSGRNATVALLACLTVAMGVLWTLLVRGEFGFVYVAEHTSRALPLIYKLTALWAGAAGSLLLWLWLQSGFVVLVFFASDKGVGRFCAHARIIANLVAVFFLCVLIFDKDPFSLSVTTPADGAGLNPLLQHPAMALHPPTLFVGYAAFAIPFAWTFAALRSDASGGSPVLFERARNWSLLAWMFLTTGIGLGAWWAYEELGWGGYWAWDPVENSSLIPWLTATALLHCGRTYRANTKIATWFMILSLVTFSLCIFGTFLTRYGLVTSVHAFPEPGLGMLFLVLLVHIWVLAGLLFFRWCRRTRATSDRVGPGLRFIVLNNWLLVLLAFVILTGTLFPFLSGLFTDEQISLQSSYFTRITAPGGLALLLLLSVCPYLWRHGFNKSWRTLGAVLVALVGIAIWLLAHDLALVCLVLCLFAGLNLLVDVVRGRTGGLRWCGARIVHLGVVLAFVGIAGSGGYGLEKQVALRPGERIEVGKFELAYDDLGVDHGPNFTAVTANIAVFRKQRKIDELAPSLAFYSQSGQRTSEVDIRRTLLGDLYLALTEVDNSTELINLTVHTKPLINWIWIGMLLSVVGTALILGAVVSKRRPIPQGQVSEE
jgi:cytochrome c-type biogenesis protein CcmF